MNEKYLVYATSTFVHKPIDRVFDTKKKAIDYFDSICFDFITKMQGVIMAEVAGKHSATVMLGIGHSAHPGLTLEQIKAVTGFRTFKIEITIV